MIGPVDGDQLMTLMKMTAADLLASIRAVKAVEATLVRGSARQIKAAKLANGMFDTLDNINKAIEAIESGDELALARLANQQHN